MTNPQVDLLADGGFSSEPIYIADLDKCLPSNAMGPDPKSRSWRTLSYESDVITGVMILAGPETAAPDITYHVNVSGWYAVSIGIYGERRNNTRVQVKRSGDDTFSILTVGPTDQVQGGQIQEVFWKVTDLTDHHLVLGQMSWRVASGDGPGTCQSAPAGIAYIKLVKLTTRELEAWLVDQKSIESRTLFAHNDAHSVHFLDRPTTAADIRRHVEVYRNSDISRLYWEAGIGDLAFYFSKIGSIPTHDDLGDFTRQGDRLLAESWRIFRTRKEDPFQIALDYAHEIGLEFHAGYRVAGFHHPPPGDHFNSGYSLYSAHPEWCGEDRNGNRTPRLAYTYPGVRQFVLSILREIAEFDIDGICLLYNRRPPLVEYEPQLVDGFKTEYGEDPRGFDENDQRWLKYRSSVLTEFHREIREAMDDVGEKRGLKKRIEVSAIVMSSEHENMVNGMDLKKWVDEGLVDTLIPYTSVPGVNSTEEAWEDVTDIDYFVAITRDTSCKLAPNIMPRENTPKQYREKATALYKAGVEHLFFWDTDVLQPRLVDVRSWNTLCRLGHRDEINAWINAGKPCLEASDSTLRKLGDWDLSYMTPG